MSLLDRHPPKKSFQTPRTLERSTPLHWSQFFSTKESVKVGPDDTFCVYRAGSSSISKNWPIVVFIHGGGYSGLTWATTVKSLLKYVDIPVIAIDIRGHGETVTKNDHDLSLPTMASDVVNVLKELGLEGHSLILVGHSLGGSLGIHVTNKINSEDEMSVVGLVVVDVVEGSALNALPNMYSILRNRPFEFQSLNAAIEWSMKSGHCRHPESSRVSVPGQLKYTRNDKPCSLEIPKPGEELVKESVDVSSTEGKSCAPKPIKVDAILEEDTEEEERSENSEVDKNPVLMKKPTTTETVYDQSTACTWRVDLDRTDVYWQAWFVGISAMFLSISCPRMLILAGVDRLDRELTIAQMQGKFQMKVVDRVGHTVHEDDPEEVATGLAQFLVRHKLANATKDIPYSMPEC